MEKVGVFWKIQLLNAEDEESQHRTTGKTSSTKRVRKTAWPVIFQTTMKGVSMK